eukprot:TRINITY_DN25145_c0_g1_i1.p1 TRINITY_DN25145_c0_g1~~TRINITY_DN25145_c0_g1_i1.p1  ORF type:complete len:150 (+),score=37.00 TRINITY_DN25145_c0_g1_i1:102-551(+)
MDVFKELSGFTDFVNPDHQRGITARVLHHLDLDKDGMLTLEELNKIAEYGTTTNISQLLITFLINAADKDKNGLLTAAEMKDYLTWICTGSGVDMEEVDEAVGEVMDLLSEIDDPTNVKIDVVIKEFVGGPTDPPEPKDGTKYVPHVRH